MSKTSVAFLTGLYLVLLLALDKHYYAVINENFKFTAWVLTQYCHK